jgi:hypothetical protein
MAILHRGPLEYDNPPLCPTCGAEPTERGYAWSTLVGYPPGQDDNHQHQDFYCRPCDLKYTRHWREHSRRVWMTAHAHNREYLIKGEVGCFENYIDPRKES